MVLNFNEYKLTMDLRVGDIHLPVGSDVWVQVDLNNQIIEFNYPLVRLFGPVVTIFTNNRLINIPKYYIHEES